MPAPENYSVVILGAMNPQLHHPSFYRHVDIIDDEEEARAVASVDLVCSRQVAQLNVKGARIICMPDRYQVASPSAELASEVMDIAASAMDALPHTPTSTFGFNFDRVRTTGLTNVGARFSELASALPLGQPREASAMASFKYVTVSELQEATQRLTLILEPVADDPHAVHVKCNFNYEVKPVKGLYDLGALIRRLFPTDMVRSEQTVERTLRAMAVH